MSFQYNSNIYIYICVDVVVPHIIAQCWEPAASGWVKKKITLVPKGGVLLGVCPEMADLTTMTMTIGYSNESIHKNSITAFV